MKTIFTNMFKAINSVVVLFGGNAIEFDFNTYFDTIVAWFDSVGIHFAEDEVATF